MSKEEWVSVIAAGWLGWFVYHSTGMSIPDLVVKVLGL